MADNVSINGSVSGDWNQWERERDLGRAERTTSRSMVNTFLVHMREYGVAATEVMFQSMGDNPVDKHKLKDPKCKKLDTKRSMSQLRSQFLEAKKVYAQEQRRKAELERRQKLAAETVTQATQEATRKVKNAKRNAKKRAAKRRIKLDKMKREMQEKLELAQTLRNMSANGMKKGMQHTVEGRKFMLKWANEATQLTLEAADLTEKLMAEASADVKKALPHMASIVDNKTEEKVEEEDVDVDEEEFTCEVCHTPYHRHCPGCWECADCDTCKCGPESHFYKPPPTAELPPLSPTTTLELVAEEQVQCYACRDTGTAYYSDDVYGPCLDCDQGESPPERTFRPLTEADLEEWTDDTEVVGQQVQVPGLECTQTIFGGGDNTGVRIPMRVGGTGSGMSRSQKRNSRKRLAKALGEVKGGF